MHLVRHDPVMTLSECACLAGFRIGTRMRSRTLLPGLVLLNPAVHLFMGGGCTVVISECGEGVCRGILLDEVLGYLHLRITA